jgi:thiosulfate/3-mercaptopyruvate sulfurtransferase
MTPLPLVSVSWLRDHLDDADVVVADVRWYLGGGQRAAEAYAAGHVPGALFIDLDRDLARPPGQGRPGRHPLPDAGSFAGFLRRSGVGAETVVVSYDDAGGATAARLWWLLGYFGHPGGRVLDGGIQAWTAAGLPLESSARPPRALAPALALTADTSKVVDRLALQTALERGSAVVIDARAAERFQGKIEPVDARPGHIPGAVNVPFTENLRGPGGAFRDPADLAERYRAAGVGRALPVIAYCGSGVTACHDLLALQLTGTSGVLYEGSWSDWAGDASLPAALGA